MFLVPQEAKFENLRITVTAQKLIYTSNTPSLYTMQLKLGRKLTKQDFYATKGTNTN